jgi:two-component system, chemotaxis family, chemotaxis protein CheY
MALNVLVVDDSAVMRSMIIKALGLTGLPIREFSQAANGEEALEILTHQWIDLALVDINMPVMGGVELIARIRETPELKDLPVVVVSTESSTTRIAELEQKGARFVHKPFSPEALRSTVVELTGVACEE